MWKFSFILNLKKNAHPFFYSERDNDRRVPRPHLPKKKRVSAYPDLNLMEFLGMLIYSYPMDK